MPDLRTALEELLAACEGLPTAALRPELVSAMQEARASLRRAPDRLEVPRPTSVVDVHELRQSLDDRVSAFLRGRGWHYTSSNNPACYWLWERQWDGHVLAMPAETALSMEASIEAARCECVPVDDDTSEVDSAGCPVHGPPRVRGEALAMSVVIGDGIPADAIQDLGPGVAKFDSSLRARGFDRSFRRGHWVVVAREEADPNA